MWFQSDAAEFRISTRSLFGQNYYLSTSKFRLFLACLFYLLSYYSEIHQVLKSEVMLLNVWNKYERNMKNYSWESPVLNPAPRDNECAQRNTPNNRAAFLWSCCYACEELDNVFRNSKRNLLFPQAKEEATEWGMSESQVCIICLQVGFN